MKKVPFNTLRFQARMLRRLGTGLTLSALLISASSCSSVSRYARNVFHRNETALAEADRDDTKVEHAHADKEIKTAERPDDSKLVHADSQEKGSEKSPELKSGSATSLAALTGKKSESSIADPFAEIQPASGEEIVSEAAPVQPVQHEALPRMTDPAFAGTTASFPTADCPPENCPTGNCPPSTCQARPFPAPEYIGDEFVCDGGDKNLPVHYEGQDRAGLDVEDTVAEFLDDEGVFHVKPSTEACVYAPRFGAVRSATGTELDLAIEKAAGHQDQQYLEGLDAKAVIDQQVQSDEAQGMLTRARPSQLDGQAADDRLSQTVAAQRHIVIANAHEKLQFFREGLFDRLDTAVVEAAMASAIEWSDGRVAIIIAHDQSGQIVQARTTPQDITGIEDRRTPGDLRIVKVADRNSGHPGDVVTFTIRFDNVGDRPLTAVRIVDNLSPRLAYLDGSVDSNLDGEVHVDDNGAGGKLLTFEFDRPLEGKTGGYITFQCRLR